MGRISEKDIKELWGSSAGRCAMCKLKLIFDSDNRDTIYNIGENAHMVARKPRGPRGDHTLESDKRDRASNLLLLCPNHHKHIDKNKKKDWPTKKLYQMKKDHERWVDSQLSGKSKEQIARLDSVSIVIEAIDRFCSSVSWEWWTAEASGHSPIWHKKIITALQLLERKTSSSVYLEEFFELSFTINLIIHHISKVWSVFIEYSVEAGDVYIGHKYYMELPPPVSVCY